MHTLCVQPICSIKEGVYKSLFSRTPCRPSMKLHYPDYPLKIVRGRGQYFFDENDERYLDTTNNVAHGECGWTYKIDAFDFTF